MKTMLRLPVVAAFALALLPCFTSCSVCDAVPSWLAGSAGERPFASARRATAIGLRYEIFSFGHGSRREASVNVTGEQMEGLAKIISRVQTYPDYIGADLDYRGDVCVCFVVDGKSNSIGLNGISRKSKADKYYTCYILSDADYAELMGILRALDPIGFFKDED